MSTMYQITSDIKAIATLADQLVDEEGNLREPTEEEKAYLLKCIGETEYEFTHKFDNICKYAQNLKIEADIAHAEYQAHQDELKRLSRTAKAREYKRDTLRCILQEAMNRLGMQRFKTALFSANIQATAKHPRMVLGFKVPNDFAKPIELDTVKVKEAVQSGLLTEKSGRLYYNGTDTGIAYVGGQTCVLR